MGVRWEIKAWFWRNSRKVGRNWRTTNKFRKKEVTNSKAAIIINKLNQAIIIVLIINLLTKQLEAVVIKLTVLELPEGYFQVKKNNSKFVIFLIN